MHPCDPSLRGTCVVWRAKWCMCMPDAKGWCMHDEKWQTLAQRLFALALDAAQRLAAARAIRPCCPPPHRPPGPFCILPSHSLASAWHASGRAPADSLALSCSFSTSTPWPRPWPSIRRATTSKLPPRPPPTLSFL